MEAVLLPSRCLSRVVRSLDGSHSINPAGPQVVCNQAQDTSSDEIQIKLFCVMR